MDTTTIRTSVFRKKTHTDHYLNFGSHHHPRVKRGIVKCLKSRAEKVCHVTKRLSELNHLHKVFTANGYPDRLLKKTLSWCPTPRNPSSNTEAERPQLKPLFLPYVQGITEKIQHV